MILSYIIFFPFMSDIFCSNNGYFSSSHGFLQFQQICLSQFVYFCTVRSYFSPQCADSKGNVNITFRKLACLQLSDAKIRWYQQLQKVTTMFCSIFHYLFTQFHIFVLHVLPSHLRRPGFLLDPLLVIIVLSCSPTNGR